MSLLVICPHCNDYILIEKLNCGIFRHSIFKNNGQQVPPHSSKEECDKYIANNEIYGCGKPFKINIETNMAEKCEYI